MEIGTLLRFYRIQKGLTQAELSKSAGMTRGYVPLIETGKRKNVSIKYTRKLAKALELTEIQTDAFYESAGYISPSFLSRQIPDNLRYSNLYKVFTTKPPEVTIEDFSEAVFEALSMIEEQMPSQKSEKNKLVELIARKIIDSSKNRNISLTFSKSKLLRLLFD